MNPADPLVEIGKFLWFLFLTLSLTVFLARLYAGARATLDDDPKMAKALGLAIFVIAITIAKVLVY